MTHPPTLPNGFSDDFYDGKSAFARLVRYTFAPLPRPMAWTRYPTPGDAVLKELAEGK